MAAMRQQVSNNAGTEMTASQLEAPTIMDGRQLFKVVKSRIPAERF